MKTSVAIIILLLSTFGADAQTTYPKAPLDSTYAIIQVLVPKERKLNNDNIVISIFYGNNKVEEFRFLDTQSKSNLSNEIVDALNYLKTKGYRLDQTLNFDLSNNRPGNMVVNAYIEIQYIMKRISAN
jgi:hypothetical protein